MLSAARPEVELLVRCARSELETDRSSRVEALVQEDLNWEFLLELARRHGVTPLLHSQLTMVAEPAIPDLVLECLQNAVRHNAEWNLHLTSELRRLLDRFDEEDISVIPYKGPVLAQYAYDSLALREFADLDILIRRQDVQKVKSLLESDGYRLTNFTPFPGYRENDILRRNTVILPRPEFAFYQGSNAIKVELRWQLGSGLRSFDVPFDEFWARHDEMTMAGRSVQSLSPEDRILVLTTHGWKHHWHRLEWICGIAAVLRRDEELSWPLVFARARELGRHKETLCSLLIAAKLLHVDLPESVCNRVRTNPGVVSLASESSARVINNFTSEPDPVSGLVFDLKVCENSVDALSLLLHVIFYPRTPEYEFVPLPRRLHPVYYLIRPCRLAEHFGPKILHGWLFNQ